MTNLFLEIAAKKGYYTIDNLPKEVLTNTWFSERLEWYKKQWAAFNLPDSLNFDYVGKFMKIETEGEDLTHMERITILAFDGVNIRSLLNYKGKYTMFPLWEDTWIYRQHLDARDFPQIDSPKGMGVFTATKLKAWFNYCDMYVDALIKASETNQSKEQENRAVITNFIESVKKLDPAVKVWDWKNEFGIESKGFEVTLKLHDKGTFLSQEVKFRGGLDDILKMMS